MRRAGGLAIVCALCLASRCSAGAPSPESEDAGSIDAGASDSGPRDAGHSDAGSADSGPIDSGPTDAGRADGGPGASCLGDGDCLPGLSCWTGWPGGYCYQSCQVSCSQGTVCRSDATTPGGICEKACAQSGDCGRSGYACIASGCSPCGGSCPPPDAWTCAPSDAGPPDSGSWNSAISCAPVVTTIAAIVGVAAPDCTSNCGGTFDGGGFRPGLSCRRALAPACDACGTPVFVELHGVAVADVAVGDCNGPMCAGDVAADAGSWRWCDTTMTLRDPGDSNPDANLTALHCEIDQTWKAIGTAPEDPVDGQLIDVQGFVFWDPDHTSEAFHYYSGWELHPITAWRPHQ